MRGGTFYGSSRAFLKLPKVVHVRLKQARNGNTPTSRRRASDRKSAPETLVESNPNTTQRSTCTTVVAVGVRGRQRRMRPAAVCTKSKRQSRRLLTPTEGCDAQDKYLRQLVCQGLADNILDADLGCRRDVRRATRNLKVGNSLAMGAATAESQCEQESTARLWGIFGSADHRMNE